MSRVLALVLVVLLAAPVLWAMRHDEIPPVAPGTQVIAPDAAERGALLAAAGGCASCHGADLAGGHPIPTPFGTIHTTNITPDPDTGIGRWSEAAFVRAMRLGINRRGDHLYPAFPYDNFTLMTDADLSDLFAYLVTQPPVAQQAPANGLRFPFNIRLALAGWNALFLTPGPWQPDPNRDEVWNRGAYLAEGAGHCSACHTPRNRFGARRPDDAYSGGYAEGWWSPALNAQATAPLAWTRDELVNYLFDGWDENHGIAAGPMKHVVENIAQLPEADVIAIATYIADRMPAPQPDRDARRDALAAQEAPAAPDHPTLQAGAEVFAAKCLNCHRAGTETVPLSLATAVTGPKPDNFLRIVRDGVTPTENAFFVRPMPGFADLSPDEATALAAYVRQYYGAGVGAAWPDLPQTAEAIFGD